MECKFMGRQLAVAMDQKIDMNAVLSYPLTPIPLCLSHLDGSIYSTPKATMLNCLEKRNVSSNHFKVDVKIIDGFFLLHLFHDLPAKFCKTCSHIFGMNCKRVDLIFDHIVAMSRGERGHSGHVKNRTVAVTLAWWWTGGKQILGCC